MLLKLITEKFEQVPPHVDEGNPKRPEDLLLAARAKAHAVGEKVKKAIVIAADTGVFVAGQHLGKPRDLDEARRMLAALSGRQHTVVTGVCVLSPTGVEEELISTRVKFFPLTRKEIDWYLGSEEVLDKAGAYGIQGRAGHGGRHAHLHPFRDASYPFAHEKTEDGLIRVGEHGREGQYLHGSEGSQEVTSSPGRRLRSPWRPRTGTFRKPPAARDPPFPRLRPLPRPAVFSGLPRCGGPRLRGSASHGA